MKFVALALALLLAVGSQAASLQADAPAPPTQLEHFRAALDVYLAQLKESATKALNQLDGTEFSEFKSPLSTALDELHGHVLNLQKSVRPNTDSVISTISESTAAFRSSIMNDLDNMKTDIEPMRVKLEEVIEKHITEYKEKLNPIITEYYTKHTEDMEALKTKLEPVIAELREKVVANVEETKAALIPILEHVSQKVTERMENLKEMVSPYVEEYKEQLKNVYEETKTLDVKDLKEKIAPLADDIKLKLKTIFDTITAAVTKN